MMTYPCGLNCKQCKFDIHPTFNFCPGCGCRLDSEIFQPVGSRQKGGDNVIKDIKDGCIQTEETLTVIGEENIFHPLNSDYVCEKLAIGKTSQLKHSSSDDSRSIKECKLETDKNSVEVESTNDVDTNYRIISGNNNNLEGVLLKTEKISNIKDQTTYTYKEKTESEIQQESRFKVIKEEEVSEISGTKLLRCVKENPTSQIQTHLSHTLVVSVVEKNHDTSTDEKLMQQDKKIQHSPELPNTLWSIPQSLEIQNAENESGHIVCSTLRHKPPGIRQTIKPRTFETFNPEMINLAISKEAEEKENQHGKDQEGFKQKCISLNEIANDVPCIKSVKTEQKYDEDNIRLNYYETHEQLEEVFLQPKECDKFDENKAAHIANNENIDNVYEEYLAINEKAQDTKKVLDIELSNCVRGRLYEDKSIEINPKHQCTISANTGENVQAETDEVFNILQDNSTLRSTEKENRTSLDNVGDDEYNHNGLKMKIHDDQIETSEVTPELGNLTDCHEKQFLEITVAQKDDTYFKKPLDDHTQYTDDKCNNTKMTVKVKKKNKYQSQQRSCQLLGIQIFNRRLSDIGQLYGEKIFILYTLHCLEGHRLDPKSKHWLEWLNKIRKRILPSPKKLDKKVALRLLQSSNQVIKQVEDCFTFISEDVRDEAFKAFFKAVGISQIIKFSSLTSLKLYFKYEKVQTKINPAKILYTFQTKDVVSTLLVQRLQLDSLVHDFIHDRQFCMEIQKAMPYIDKDIIYTNAGEREGFCKTLKENSRVIFTRYECSLTDWMETITKITKSTIGKEKVYPLDIFVIGDEVRTLQEPFSDISVDQRSILYSILTQNWHFDSDQWMEHLKLIRSVMKIAQAITKEEVHEQIEQMKGKFLKQQDSFVLFCTDEIRHRVMLSFLMDHLWHERKLEFFISCASHSILEEYCRNQSYKPLENERCIYLPDSALLRQFIRKIQTDVILHCTMHNEDMREHVSKILKIPLEVLCWETDERLRYLNYTKRGTKSVYRARGMIVGCASAGKTTFLRRLKRDCLQNLQKVQTTIGLDVHNEIFEIDEFSKSPFDPETTTDEAHERGVEFSDFFRRKLLSILDFGGQYAYYACHQIYLSSRAFYFLVVDMSKDLNSQVDSVVCDQCRTMFSDWKYKDYFVFWTKSIHTYCSDDSPVILIATHCENKTEEEIKKFFQDLLNQLPEDGNLHQHFKRDRYFAIRFPNDDKSVRLEEIEKCIVKIIQKQNHWGEKIPSIWAEFYEIVKRASENSKLLDLKEFKRDHFEFYKEKEFKDMLHFYHEIGVILYFDEECLNDTLILDVQWFVDIFKFVITDSDYIMEKAPSLKEWNEYNETGVLPHSLLQCIWNAKKLDFINQSTTDMKILLIMQRLGLIAIGEQSHYIPSMNKRYLDDERRQNILQSTFKTSTIYFRFEFLPLFVFHRLVVSCIARIGWSTLTDDYKCIYKNIAIFRHKEHNIVLAVSKSDIQAMIYAFRHIETEVVVDIRQSLNREIQILSKNFHKPLTYVIGFSCLPSGIDVDIKDAFITEEQLLSHQTTECPRHSLRPNHTLHAKNLLCHWNKGFDKHLESFDDPENNFKRFKKLIRIAEEALRIVFHKYFPPEEFQDFLKCNKVNFNNNKCILNKQDLTLLTSGKNITSSDLDITLMCKLLRNYSDIPAPSQNWSEIPDTESLKEADDVIRILKHRNYLSHSTTWKIESSPFKQKKLDLCLPILRLSNNQLQDKIDAF